MIRVTCAIIEAEGKVLVAQRSAEMSLPLKWEFPGGKVEEGETAEACILREIKEELGLEIRILRRVEAHSYAYPGKSILLIPFICEVMGGELKLLEHAGVMWVDREGLRGLDWAAADVGVLETYLVG